MDPSGKCFNIQVFFLHSDFQEHKSKVYQVMPVMCFNFCIIKDIKESKPNGESYHFIVFSDCTLLVCMGPEG